MELGQLSADVEEISQRYAEHFGFRRDETWFLLKLQEEVGELTQAYLAKTGQARAKDRTPEELESAFRAELADVLCHLLLLARHHEVDMAAEVSRKWLRHL
ncbi:pyrophosphatase [Micromonosporaceae bacterium Da 78-11]